MKSDQYLNLCLEQAALSPLRYRHGCVVVKGGKVLGRGFNDYRPGYDGGGLKTGLLPKAAEPAARAADPAASLSMHSEMMAINAALASSCGAPAPAASRPRPGANKVRRAALVAYVQRVCVDALEQGPQRPHSSGKKPPRARARTGGSLKPVHLDSTRRKGNAENPNGKKENDGKKPDAANRARSPRSTAAVQGEEQDNIYTGNIAINAVRDRYRRSPSSLSKSVERESKDAKGQHSTAPLNSPMPSLKGRTGSPGCGVQDRKKHPKLVGADVYVARLVSSPAHPPASTGPDTPQEACVACDEHRDASSLATTPPGSLHDELTCPPRPDPRAPTPRGGTVPDRRGIAESRPCYRCVSYMHAVGIKRVFWTNGEGGWESAKVRDLADSLGGPVPGSSGDESDPGTGAGDMFVTKHEVLMMRKRLAATAR